MTDDSYVEVNGWLVWEDLFFDADDWSIDRVVNVWQVGLGWSLSDSSEFIVHRSVTQADPSLVSSQIWHWNATQVSANSRAHKNAGVTGIRKSNNRLLVEQGCIWKSVGVFDFGNGKSSNENKLSVRGGLENFTRWEL